MKSIYQLSLIFLSILILNACNTKEIPALDLSQEAIIPVPTNMQATGSSFELNSETSIYTDGDLQVAHYLAKELQPAMGFELDIKPSSSKSKKNSIQLNLVDDASHGEEGYQLDINNDQITINANTEHGLFNGIQSLRQLMPVEIEKNTVQNQAWHIASGTITDKPEYKYRGAMLDVARHFFQVEDVKRYIDLLSHYKINMLHLHLSDDQGWRIEIKSWPNLTTHGGSSSVNGENPGFFTQNQYKEIVDYAAERFITIIPEIDMPGHTNAALSSYPELNCDGKAPPLYTGIEVGFSTLCTDKEIVYTFIDDVVKELAAMTPGPYIHIGGDESHVTELKDYIPFIERTAEIVKKHGKEVIGWDEIAHAKLPENSVVHYWNVAENAKKGVDQNAKVLMSPAKKTYLDMQYDSTTRLGLHWAAYIEIDDAYNWEPTELIEGLTRKDILGIESPLWSETILNMDDIEYMAFPRIIAHAEIGWSPKEKRNWEEFKTRLIKHGGRLEALDINYYKSKILSKSTIKP